MEQWIPIGIAGTEANNHSDARPFMGTFDGNGHQIIGLYINSSSQNNQGLFGAAGSGTIKAIIKNLGVVKSFVKGNGDVGGIIGGWSNATIDNSYFIGNVVVSSGKSAGGIATRADVSNSYFVGTVGGGTLSGGTDRSETWGGITAGWDENGGTITNSYYNSKLLQAIKSLKERR